MFVVFALPLLSSYFFFYCTCQVAELADQVGEDGPRYGHADSGVELLLPKSTEMASKAREELAAFDLLMDDEEGEEEGGEGVVYDRRFQGR